jgi:hypothetical protein
MVYLSIAICVCDEHKELDILLDSLKHLTVDHELKILIDTGRVTPDVKKVLMAYPSCDIYERKFAGDFAAHKNFLNSKCNGNYIWNLDADEVPSDILITQIEDVLTADADLVLLPRVNIVLGKLVGDFTRNEYGFVNWPDYQGRIYKNKPGIEWVGIVHEKIQGAEKVIRVEPQPNLALWHVKTSRKCEKQLKLYEGLAA